MDTGKIVQSFKEVVESKTVPEVEEFEVNTDKIKFQGKTKHKKRGIVSKIKTCPREKFAWEGNLSLGKIVYVGILNV